MAVCNVCGKDAGYLSSLCAECREAQPSTITPSIRPSIVSFNQNPLQIDPIDRFSANSGLAHALFSFDGRVGRGTFWAWVLLFASAQFGASYWVVTTAADHGVQVAESAVNGASLLVSFLLLWPGLAITVKRWHDVDKSGRWVLINFIPILGWIISLVFNGFVVGTQGANRFGPQNV